MFDFRSALQRRGSEGLPNSRAWGRCEAVPPGLTMAIILFRAGNETRGENLENLPAADFRMILKQVQKYPAEISSTGLPPSLAWNMDFPQMNLLP
jgi:hypothetical protein